MDIPFLGHVSQGALALLIPIIAVVGAFASQMFTVYHRAHRQRELLQLYPAERMAAIDKGIELPPLPADLCRERSWGTLGKYDRGRSNYRGIMTLLVGVAITLALWKTNGGESFWWGLIIVAVGLSQLVIHFLERRDRALHPPAGAAHSTESGDLRSPEDGGL